MKRGLWLSFSDTLFFGLNYGFAGEVNYQGGERKTFYSRFPFETAESTFGVRGNLDVDGAGGAARGGRGRGEGDVKRARHDRRSFRKFLRNLGYFWVGRFGGALALLSCIS